MSAPANGQSDPLNVSIPSPPFDSVSKVKYSPTDPSLFIAGSWDATVRLYQYDGEDGKTTGNEAKAKFDRHRAAVLDCCFSGADNGQAFSGGLDSVVRSLDLKTEGISVLGSHENSISSTVWSQNANSLITGSWDRTIRLWDPRADGSKGESAKTNTPERIYHMDVVQNTVVVAMASRLFQLYDVRRVDKPVQERESSLKYMTRSLACMTDGRGYATSSVEGRIAVEYFDAAAEVQELKYAFKCHRQTVGDVDHVWPVNALAFHPVHNTFASAGSDGALSIWDHKVKKRLRQYPKFSSPIASIAFNCDGTRMAIATSYTWDQGEKGMRESESPRIYVRKIGDECKPKEAK